MVSLHPNYSKYVLLLQSLNPYNDIAENDKPEIVSRVL